MYASSLSVILAIPSKYTRARENGPLEETRHEGRRQFSAPPLVTPLLEGGDFHARMYFPGIGQY